MNRQQIRNLNRGVDLIKTWRKLIDSDLCSRDFRLANVLLWFANQETGRCNPHYYNHLIPKTRLTRTTLLRAIQSLEQGQWIARYRHPHQNAEYGLLFAVKIPVAEYAGCYGYSWKTPEDLAELADCYPVDDVWAAMVKHEGLRDKHTESQLQKLHLQFRSHFEHIRS